MRIKILIQRDEESLEAQYILHLFGYVWASERDSRDFKIIDFDLARDEHVCIELYNFDKILMYNLDPSRSDLSESVSLKEALRLIENI